MTGGTGNRGGTAGGRSGFRSPVLVGRERELTLVASALAAPPAVAVVEGESGIGKTRLVTELPGRPELAGRRFLTGWCRRIREPFPLGPVLDAVRGGAAHLAGATLSPLAGALRSWLPELADQLPPAPAPLPDRVADRHRTFRALAEVLDRVGPAVLVLEDMHWADEQTVDFLHYLLVEPPTRLSLVLTFRTEDVTTDVRALAAKLPAVVTRAETRLAPLDLAQTGVLAAAVLGVNRVPDPFAEDVYARTSGSPFAVEELMGLLRGRGGYPLRLLSQVRPGAAPPDRPRPDGAAGPAPGALPAEPEVPPGIRDLVRERAGRLTGDTRALVDAAAVLQTPAPVSVLAGVCDLSPARAVQAADAALAAGLLVEHGPQVGFRHLLAAQAVYEGISGPRRQELHARAASVLLASEPTAWGPAAHHRWCAGDLTGWAETAQQAADHAVRLGADDEAARLLDQLLRYAPLGPEERGRVAVKLARAALESLHDQDVSVLEQALADELPPPVRGELRFLTAVLLDRLGTDPARQRQLCREAIPELVDRPALRAWAMMCLAIPAGGDGSVSEHRQWLERSLAALPATGDDAGDRLAGMPGLTVGVLGKAAMVLLALGDRGWRQVYDRLLTETGDPPRGRRDIFAHYSVAVAAVQVGHHDLAETLLERTQAGVSDRDPPQVGWAVLGARGLLDFSTGAWEGLAERIDRLQERPVSSDVRGYLATARGCLALARGEIDNARGRLTSAVEPVAHGGDSWSATTACGALIRLALAQGDVTGAREVAGRLRTAWTGKRLWAPLPRALPAMVRAELAAGDGAAARRLVAAAETELADLEAPLAPAALRFAQGLVAADRGDHAEAAALLRAAANWYDRLRCPYEAAQAREQAAVSSFTVGDEAGGPVLAAALATYRRLGAGWDLDRAGKLARQYGVPVPARHRGGRRGYGQQVTPREREVVELAVTGRTNAEIAEALFLSTSTVKKHLAAAMRKVGVRSRAALAHRWAHHTDAVPGKDGPDGP